jgi:hypothetical protein
LLLNSLHILCHASSSCFLQFRNSKPLS